MSVIGRQGEPLKQLHGGEQRAGNGLPSGTEGARRTGDAEKGSPWVGALAAGGRLDGELGAPSGRVERSVSEGKGRQVMEENEAREKI